jgi:hypothetical protein
LAVRIPKELHFDAPANDVEIERPSRPIRGCVLRTGSSGVATVLLYESPFTDVTPRGPDGIFTSSQLDELLAVLDQVRAAALAA